jgi:guanine deaminase
VKKRGRPVRTGLASDVGGGTSLSMLATLAEAYKVARLRGASLAPGELFHLATRGGAEALDLHHRIGGIAPGLEADLVLLDLCATPLLAQRVRHADDLDDALFALIVLGDDRAVRATWVAGRPVHRRELA